MMPRTLLVAGLILGMVPPCVAGSSVRYALVVGNDHGRTPPGVVIPDLRHAEREARRLRDRLVNLGNFDDAGGRVVLVVGQGRAEILKAAQRLAEIHRADREQLGEVNTLFAFFFTGHGLEGKLLTADEPLNANDLAAVFRDVGATFTVGVFDACFSGSLDLEHLRQKGLRTTPGFNAFEELPREMLNSSGTMWFTSSRPDQISYEDDRLGGVFTHFFIEAMERAESDRIGVTLEEIWEYARSRTQRHTSRGGRPQTPQKLVREMTSTGPLYFSFPTPRSAVLVFDAGVSGPFLARYESGQLTELIRKQPGAELRVPVYPGEVSLERVQAGGRERQHFSLEPGAIVQVRSGSWTDEDRLGSRETALVAKGGRLEGLVLTENIRHWSGLVELGYRVAFGSDYGAAPLHNGTLALRLDRGPLVTRLALSYGRIREDFPAWGYTLDRGDLRLEAGPGFDLGIFRLSVTAEAGLLYRAAAYRDGTERSQIGVSVGAAAGLLVPLVREPFDVYLGVRAGISAERAAPVAPVDAPEDWTLVPCLVLGVGVGLF